MHPTNPAIIWNGFHFKWEKYPHRLSILGSRFLPAPLENSGHAGYEHLLNIKVGNWPPERALYRVPYFTISSNNHFIAKGTTTAETCCMIEVGTSVKHAVSIPLGNLNIVNWPEAQNPEHLAVLLNGFSISSVNNPSGWHFGGLGIDIIDKAEINNNCLEFEVEIYARPARSPELMTHGNRQWNYRTNCIYRFDIDFLVIGGSKENIHLVSADYEQKDSTARITFDNRLKAVIKGVPDAFSQAVTGLSGFKFKLEAQDKRIFNKRTGRYVRELGFINDPLSYDPATGMGRFDMNLLFSNDSSGYSYLANKLKLETCLRPKLIQLNGVEEITSGTITGMTEKHLLEYRQPLVKDPAEKALLQTSFKSV